MPLRPHAMGLMVVAPLVWWQYGNDGTEGEVSRSFHRA